MGQSLIEFRSPTEARAWSDFQRVKSDPENPTDPSTWILTNTGRYHDRLVKRGERWLFAERGAYVLNMEHATGPFPPPTA